MAIPTVYRSSDSGAPVMNRATAGSAVAVLNACLSDGYGSKAPAGWDKPFSGTNKGSWRNAAGQCVRVNDPASTGTAGFDIQTFRDMSGIDTGSDSTGLAYGYRTPSNTANNATWTVMATDLAFWFAIHDSTTHRVLLSAGRFFSMSEGDAFDYYVFGSRWSSVPIYPCAALTQNPSGDPGPCGGWGAADNLSTGLYVGRLHTGLGNAVGAGILKPFITAGSSAAVGDAGYPALPSANAANAARMPAFIIHGSGADAVIRGRLPGASLPLFNTLSLDTGDADPSGSDSIFLAARASTVASTPRSGLLLSTGDWAL